MSSLTGAGDAVLRNATIVMVTINIAETSEEVKTNHHCIDFFESATAQYLTTPESTQ